MMYDKVQNVKLAMVVVQAATGFGKLLLAGGGFV